MKSAFLIIGSIDIFSYFLGMIGIGEPATLTETTGALHAFNIPLISVTPHPLGPSYSNVLTTAPDMAGQARVSTLLLMLSCFLPSSNAQCENSRNFLILQFNVKLSLV